MDLQFERTWAGAGIKVGGMAVAGMETFEGVAIRMDSLDNPWQEVNVTSIRLGLGLGGSIGVALFFAFNVGNLFEVNGQSLTDWGLNIALPRLKVNLQSIKLELELANYIEGTEFLSKAFIASLTPEKFAKLRDLVSFIFNSAIGAGEVLTSNEAKLIVLDVPALSSGVEASLFLSGGEFSTTGNVKSSKPSQPSNAANVPIITTLNPSTGQPGDTLVILGENFTDAVSVGFGDTSVPTMSVDSDTQISVTVPDGSGNVPVTVTTSAGSSTASTAAEFAYM